MGHSFLIKTLPRPLSVIICIKLHDFFGDATHNAHHGARLFNTPSSSVCDLQAVSSVGYRLVRDCTKKKPSLPINLLRVANPCFASNHTIGVLGSTVMTHRTCCVGTALFIMYPAGKHLYISLYNCICPRATTCG